MAYCLHHLLTKEIDDMFMRICEKKYDKQM